MDWVLYRQQQSYWKTKTQQNQILGKQRKSASEKTVSSSKKTKENDFYIENKWIMLNLATLMKMKHDS